MPASSLRSLFGLSGNRSTRSKSGAIRRIIHPSLNMIEGSPLRTARASNSGDAEPARFLSPLIHALAGGVSAFT